MRVGCGVLLILTLLLFLLKQGDADVSTTDRRSTSGVPGFCPWVRSDVEGGDLVGDGVLHSRSELDNRSPRGKGAATVSLSVS